MKLLIWVLLLAAIVANAKNDNKKDVKKDDGAKINSEKKKDVKKTVDSTKKSDTSKNTEQKTKKRLWFDGKSEWGEKSLNLCYESQPLPIDYYCYQYYRNYEVVYVDPIAVNPIILVYRKFIPQKFVDDFLEDVYRKQNRTKKNKKNDENFMSQYMKTFKRRKANETLLSHTGRPGVARVFRRAQSLIQTLNFNNSGMWQVLSYQKGGHAAPHYDYITYSSPDQFSKTTRNYGNRFATFALTLKSADVGGETTFVLANLTVPTEPGDVLFFTNMNKDMLPAVGSAHAECPVESGEKITATLWLRPKDQELFYSYMQNDESFAYDLDKILAPKRDLYGMSPIYDVYVYQQLLMEQFAAQHAKKIAAENEAKAGKTGKAKKS
ncbi:hypothetical protein KIN20_034173 [Parelaphostrongylus tenuis]|uniref:Fe2OG dioxygenase domain-containing protein n=1 Tax=Parelaphostrongylus tenuis TaxID=148309 RepID=A0AAD5RBW8_PARTN|nr:hypothetical protein KIN20_034173 [Parelaphostrongylus tenuis]